MKKIICQLLHKFAFCFQHFKFFSIFFPLTARDFFECGLGKVIDCARLIKISKLVAVKFVGREDWLLLVELNILFG